MNETTTPVVETPAAPVAKAKKVKKVKLAVACWCGCGGTTKSRFVPGHDARFHGAAKKVARGELDCDEQLAKLPHDEARTEFVHHIAKELPKHAAKVAEAARLAQEKADKEASIVSDPALADAA